MADLKLDPQNANRGTPRGRGMVERSLQQYGAGRSILISADDIALAGNKTLEIARELGIPVQVIESDGRTLYAIKRTDLSYDDPRARELAIADNRASETGLEWDPEVLQGFLDDGLDLEQFWFEDELADLLAGDAGDVQGLTDPDDVPEPPADPITKPGDVWLLGEHRVMCGDSTVVTDVDRLMQGRKADMVFTDPPYGIDYQDVKGKFRRIANDGLDASSVIEDALSIHPTVPTYVCCNWRSLAFICDAMSRSGLSPKACIVWDKEVPIQHLDKFYKQHEFIVYSGPFGGEPTVDGDVWRVRRETRDDHPTAKPVELVARAIGYSSKLGDLVVVLAPPSSPPSKRAAPPA
jgi:hypothetical protein